MVTPEAEPVSIDSDGAAQRTFDGVICFGGNDWWYHNRGHYDLQMMRELRERVPVLYVNSIGIRVPTLGEGGMFFTRVLRKLKSFTKGFVRIEENFAVASPITIPGAVGMHLSKGILATQVRLSARTLGIHRPLIWVTCPSAVEVVDSLSPAAVVYERTDRWEAFPDADPELITGYHQRLQSRADLALYCSTQLVEEEGADCRRAAYIDHGVDFDLFASAGSREGDEPADLRPIPRPRAGFVGAIDASTFDPELFVELARQVPEVQFVLVGGCSLESGWVDLPNVTLLGQKPYEEVARYMAGCDVLLMPWNKSDWIAACNPIKLKEYLAVGRPVVSTPFRELDHYRGFIEKAANASEFAACVRSALREPTAPEHLRARVRGDTWRAKGDRLLAELAALSIVPEAHRRSAQGAGKSEQRA